MTFVAENELERALMEAASNMSARPEFYRLLLASNLIVIGKVEGRTPAGQESFVSSGDRVQIASGQHKGNAFIPVFSSLQRLQTYAQRETEYVALNGRALLEMTRGALLILNPGSEYGKELLPEEIHGLMDPAAPSRMTIQKDTQVLIGQPAVYPQALVDALKAAFAARSDVLAAYLVQIAFPSAEQPPHPLIGVEIAGDYWDAVSAEIDRVAAAVTPGMLLDAMSLDRSSANDSVARALLKTSPFYIRQTH